MTKKKFVDDEAPEPDKYRSIEISFPFCLKNQEGTAYHRYLNDGRFETISQTKSGTSHHFGNYRYGERTINNTIARHSQQIEDVVYTKDNEGYKHGWMDADFNWLRMIATREVNISNAEFEERFCDWIGYGYALHLDPDCPPPEIERRVEEIKEAVKVIEIKHVQGNLF